MIKAGCVYAIIDPRKPCDNGILGSVFYIGITTRTIYNRLSGHIYDSKHHKGKNLHKERKIRNILDGGQSPKIICLQQTSNDNLGYLERFYIKYFTILGAKLTNISEGGEFNPMTDLPPERIKEIKEKTKVTNKVLFQKKVEEKCKELGIEIEQYTGWRLEQYKLYREQRRLNMSDKDRQNEAKYIKDRRYNLREEMGEESFKEFIAKERREWYASLSVERKEEQRQKDSNYRKTIRENETHEQKIARRAEVTEKRRAVKQKLIEEIGIEAYRQLEKDRRKNWSPRNSIIKQKSGRKPKIHNPL